jgi:DNA-binding winged helix-turn-helix (wHTH) protein
MSNRRIEFGSFTLDLERGTLLRDGSPVAVSGKGVLLLKALVKSPGAPVDKAQLMEAAWPGTAVEESNLSVQIAALRKLLGPQSDGREWVATVPRVGYKFIGDVQMPDQSAAIKRVPDPLAPTDRPSIAVLPLANVSGDKEQEYLADGLTEDIITALTRFRWFRVIGRNSSFVYKGIGRSIPNRSPASLASSMCWREASAVPVGRSAFPYSWLTLHRLDRFGPNAMRWSWQRSSQFRTPSRNGWRVL